MEEDLSKMKTEELGILFPILLLPHNSEWGKKYIFTKNQICQAFNNKQLVSIEHIGSTAIPGLLSKPTIDILLQIKPETCDQTIIERLNSLGFILIPKPENPPPHMLFVKGYTRNGFRGQAYHLHVRYPGDWDEIYFRDYLRSHPDIVKEYAQLKERLAVQHRNDREAYTEAKTSFVNRVNRLARLQEGRYMKTRRLIDCYGDKKVDCE